ncbi:hypothetical protein A3A20_00565 [Candidatus Wolfebacteria bacterium RIFCSPLOWO2_01_FULL_45_19]|uniref:Uncharacterized protein n=1 Tax=Candidatus Wolfebacteria bacterium RIFCSPLOWO2_01_FULL_45_19 TaxID=1802557 RepID=A0A1F8DR17_9BACT|nr:MAG: hypothetical protein A3A20_00565 [Candidatus Wolfebacteria bacterium RIFCSPLOWO2_01_FULL_45_19]
MSFALIYIVVRAFYSFVKFWRHWYVESFTIIARMAMNVLEKLDRVFAVRINFRFLLQPLYQDYTVVGRVIGPIFRLIRVIVGSLIYSVTVVAAAIFYIVWALLPVFIIYRALT